jgi:ribokinase
MNKILVIGSSNTDMVIKTSRFPEAGETIIGGDFFMFPGGKGANQAVAAKRMGGDVDFICKVGDDIFGKQAIMGFNNEGINTEFIKIDNKNASGVALITINNEGENEIVVASGANGFLTASDIEELGSAFENPEIILLQLEIPIQTVEFIIEKYQNKKIIINPAPAQKLSIDLLKNLYLITPNETEAGILTGIVVDAEESIEAAANNLLEKGIKNVIITLGSKGAFFKNSEESFFIPVQKVKAIDTTAAGDVFNGALVVALNEGKEWKSAIELACDAASISVTRMGAQASAPYRIELAE